MELRKLVVALAIGLFLAMFITEFISVIYPNDSVDILSSSTNSDLSSYGTYQRNTALIFGIFGITILIIGFLFIYLESIGTGLILGATYLVAMSGFMSLLGLSTSLFKAVGASSASAEWISVIIKGIMLALLLILGYKYVDKK